MKIYSLPPELEATLPDITSHNWIQEEEEHMNEVRDWLLSEGYTGKNCGKVYQTPVADNYARYMMVEGPGVRSFLLHLPYCDGYHDPDVEFIPKKEIMLRIKNHEAFSKQWGLLGG